MSRAGIEAGEVLAVLEALFSDGPEVDCFAFGVTALQSLEVAMGSKGAVEGWRCAANGVFFDQAVTALVGIEEPPVASGAASIA